MRHDIRSNPAKFLFFCIQNLARVNFQSFNLEWPLEAELGQFLLVRHASCLKKYYLL